MERRYIYRPVLFFAVAYAATWIPWSATAWTSQRGLEAYAVLFNLIGLLGPPGATLYLILTSGNEALKRDFHDRIVNLRRGSPVYAILAVVLPLAVICLSISMSLWFGQSADQFRLSAGPNLRS